MSHGLVAVGRTQKYLMWECFSYSAAWQQGGHLQHAASLPWRLQVKGMLQCFWQEGPGSSRPLRALHCSVFSAQVRRMGL